MLGVEEEVFIMELVDQEEMVVVEEVQVVLQQCQQ